MENKESNLILDGLVIDQKIKRIAYEIFEANFSEKKIVLAGILKRGFQLSKLLKKELSKIADFQVELVKISIDKRNPESNDVELDVEIKNLKGYCVIIVDDVLNTGKTFAYSMKPFLDISVKKIEIAVLVNRSHPKFPISAKYSGYELSTTIKEHIEVNLNSNEKSVTLN